MKICILSAFEDSLLKDTGYSVRICNLAENLAKFGNKVFLIIPGYNCHVKKINGLTVYTIKGLLPRFFLKILGKLLGVDKITSLYFYDPIFILRVSDIIKHADIVQLEQQSVGGFFALIINKIWKKLVVADCHDVLQALRVKHTNRLRRIAELFIEIITYKNVNLILTVSEEEKKLLTSYGIKENKIEVIPNGVDVEKFNVNNYIQRIPCIKKRYGLNSDYIVTFVGNMEYSPNMDSVKLIASKIAPKIKEKMDNVKFLIIGRIRKKINSCDLIFTGRVEDVAELLSVSNVAIAPLLRGSGTRLKLLEYFACSLPVVSTSVGVKGMDVKNGVHALITNDIEDFSNKIIELLKDRELALRLGSASRSLVVKKYDWKIIGRKLNKIYRRLIKEIQN